MDMSFVELKFFPDFRCNFVTEKHSSKEVITLKVRIILVQHDKWSLETNVLTWSVPEVMKTGTMTPHSGNRLLVDVPYDLNVI